MQISAIHLAAIRVFAHRYGRNWKLRLNSMWWSGADAKEKHGALLRQIRNEYGPAWLENYRLDGDPGKRANNQLEGICCVERVSEILGAELTPWKQSNAVEWKYTTLKLQEESFKVGVSTGGVISIDGSPHSDGDVILTNHMFELEIRLKLELRQERKAR
ncbi:hypothetical protein V8Z74_14840 [Comamonas sp. w2-DMI]|uniref:hypothetical protein n=1 Tax=Comamonas sp. w2-DMI TaxID=3126391 RepID=UPI0032E3C72D